MEGVADAAVSLHTDGDCQVHGGDEGEAPHRVDHQQEGLQERLVRLCQQAPSLGHGDEDRAQDEDDVHHG